LFELLNDEVDEQEETDGELDEKDDKELLEKSVLTVAEELPAKKRF